MCQSVGDRHNCFGSDCGVLVGGLLDDGLFKLLDQTNGHSHLQTASLSGERRTSNFTPNLFDRRRIGVTYNAPQVATLAFVEFVELSRVAQKRKVPQTMPSRFTNTLVVVVE